MSKTFKQKLEDRLEKLQRQLVDINPLNSPATYIIEGKINEVKGIIAVYEKECEEILEAVGITQERINEYVEEDTGDMWLEAISLAAKYVDTRWRDEHRRNIVDDTVYEIHRHFKIKRRINATPEEARDQSSTEEGTSSNQ